MTCTTALGMGEDWQWVRQVIVMGQSDPTDMLKMAGKDGQGSQLHACNGNHTSLFAGGFWSGP
ncbi:hypothetical protein DFH28DRAFT_1118834 [Melampsora americana]|nr:hypothetical protein DFH28DRAFT_1118834 [Melampsora americana]